MQRSHGGRPTSVGSTLMVKFKRSELIAHLEDMGVTDGQLVDVTVTGDLIDSIITFEGSDTIRVNTS